MITEEQRTTFAQLTAEYNTGWNGDADESAAICEPSEVGTTRDTLQDFIATWGQPSDAEDGMHVWENIQRRKGEPRGTLFVMDFGEFRGVHFAL